MIHQGGSLIDAAQEPDLPLLPVQDGLPGQPEEAREGEAFGEGQLPMQLLRLFSQLEQHA